MGYPGSRRAWGGGGGGAGGGAGGGGGGGGEQGEGVDWEEGGQVGREGRTWGTRHLWPF